MSQTREIFITVTTSFGIVIEMFTVRFVVGFRFMVGFGWVVGSWRWMIRGRFMVGGFWRSISGFRCMVRFRFWWRGVWGRGMIGLWLMVSWCWRMVWFGFRWSIWCWRRWVVGCWS